MANFVAASTGDWVAITKAEYDALASNLSDVTRFGVEEANALTGTPNTADPATGFAPYLMTFGYDANPSPSNSYVFAFKVALYGDVIEGGNELVRLSSAADGTGFNQVGGSLPDGIVDGSQQHFVLKEANTLYNNPMYIGLTMDEVDHLMYRDATGVSGMHSIGSNTSVTLVAYGWSIQGLSTTSKQW